MTLAEKEQQIKNADVEISRLSNALARSSEYGDYKVLKTYEARLNEEPDPYDWEELTAKRKAARARINELQAQIKTLNETAVEEETEEEETPKKK